MCRVTFVPIWYQLVTSTKNSTIRSDQTFYICVMRRNFIISYCATLYCFISYYHSTKKVYIHIFKITFMFSVKASMFDSTDYVYGAYSNLMHLSCLWSHVLMFLRFPWCSFPHEQSRYHKYLCGICFGRHLMNVSTVMNFQRGNNFLCNLSLLIFFFASLYGQRGNSTACNLNRLRETKN